MQNLAEHCRAVSENAKQASRQMSMISGEQKNFCWPLTITHRCIFSPSSPTQQWDTLATFADGFCFNCTRVSVGNDPLCACSDVGDQISFLPYDNKLSYGYYVVHNDVKIATIENNDRKKLLHCNDREFFCRLKRKRNIDSLELGLKTRAEGLRLKLISEKTCESPVCDLALIAVCLDLWYDCYFN